jgi:acyl-CoA thioesterase I
VARQHSPATAAQTVTGILAAFVVASAAWGQDVRPGASSPAPLPAPFSRDCQAAGASDVSVSLLPHVAAALRDRKRVKILAIGASASAGRRGRGGGYTEQIEQILEAAVKDLDVVMINRGVSGELAAAAAKRIRNEVALNEPDLVLWQVGTNDALAYVPIDDLRDTLVETVAWLRAHNVDVVLAGLQFVHRMEQDDHYRAVRELIRKVAADDSVVVVRRNEAMRLIGHASVSGGGLFPEEFERTEVGYACLAEYVARAITLGAFGRGLRDQPPVPGGSPQGLPARR